MTSMNWLPSELHPVALRLARADELAYDLALVLLSWSRGDNEGAVTLRQVERRPGFYDVEVASIRPVPPVAALLFSEAIGHLRAALDNTVFHLAALEHGSPLTPVQERAIAMLIFEDESMYEEKVRRLERQGLTAFGTSGTLGSRMSALQPFREPSTVPSMSRLLGAAMSIEVVEENPLVLLREYSNFDKHRAIRFGASRALVQRPDQWERSLAGGMRPIEIGTVLETVEIGVLTPVDLSPALVVERPDGTWVAFGPELDGIARYVSDIAIPTLVTGMALPGGLPVDIDLTDNGQTLTQRAEAAGTARAHERAQPVMFRALQEAYEQDLRWADVVGEADES